MQTLSWTTPKSESRNLGVIFDSESKFKAHVGFVTKSALYPVTSHSIRGGGGGVCISLEYFLILGYLDNKLDWTTKSTASNNSDPLHNMAIKLYNFSHPVRGNNDHNHYLS